CKPFGTLISLAGLRFRQRAADPRSSERTLGSHGAARPDLRHRVLRSLAWHGWASLVGQTISWAATLFVIRLLEPSDYGLMASAGVLLGFLVALSELGLGAAVVQTRDLSRDDLRDLQVLLLLVGAASGVAMAAAGGALAWYYDEPRLESLARVLA